LEKADGYGDYLANSDLGVRDYERVPGNRGAFLLRCAQGDRVHFLFISFWESRKAIEGYAGPNIEEARYFPYDRECLLEPEPNVTHYDVMVATKTE
jgi:hypothetical protein